jgi:hypothetical protein
MFGFGCFLAGLSLGNAFAAADAGRSPLWSALAAVGGLLFALSWLPRLRARPATPAATTRS